MALTILALYTVILNEVKNLSESKTIDRHVDLEIFRFAQDDNHNIMGYIFVTHEQRRHPRRCGAVGVFWGGEIVILNVVKNLKVSETVDGSANLEILRFRSG